MPVIVGSVSASELRGRDNIRREAFRSRPTGSFPVAGFLSLTEEEEVNQEKFTWFEDRQPDFRTIMENISTTVVFANATTPYAALTADVVGLDNDDTICINVEDRSYITIGDVLDINLIDSSADSHSAKLRVTVLPDSISTRVVGKLHGLAAAITLDYNADHTTDQYVRIDTNARGEGFDVGGETGWMREPVEFYNYCQIISNVFTLTETAKISAQDYDGKGAYETLYWQHQYKHMVQLENTILFGSRHQGTDADGNNTYATGGIEWLLKEWEKAGSDYRGSGSPAVTLDADDNKRLIENAGGTLSLDDIETYTERMFRETSGQANQKLCVCGGVAFGVLMKLFKDNTSFESSAVAGQEDLFGVKWKGMMCNYGDIHFVVHPLFRTDPERKHWLMFLDMGNIKWMYMKGRNTILKRDVGLKSADSQKDQILTNAGIRAMFPESHMIIKNVKTAA
ncbi:DUF5309 domain-containing protein [bacterium]|nr:DUF5309 domain-containing protein [bacterium]